MLWISQSMTGGFWCLGVFVFLILIVLAAGVKSLDNYIKKVFLVKSLDSYIKKVFLMISQFIRYFYFDSDTKTCGYSFKKLLLDRRTVIFRYVISAVRGSPTFEDWFS